MCHTYSIHLRTGGPNVQFISAPEDQMWTNGVTHIQFISAPEDQLWTKGEKHTHVQCISVS